MAWVGAEVALSQHQLLPARCNQMRNHSSQTPPRMAEAA